MRRLRQLNPAFLAVGVIVLVALWFVRPMVHGLVLFFWTAPFVWLAPLVLLAIGGVLFRRSQRSWTTLEDLSTGVRPPSWLIGFPIAAFVVFIFAASLKGPLVERAIVKHTTYQAIPGLPANGKVRLVP